MSVRRILRDRSIIDLIEWGFRRINGISSASLRMLPDFIIIGAQRSGTTSLFNYLCQHPEIHPSFPKEVHYFSNNFHMGTNWYRSHFPLSLWKRGDEIDGQHKFVTGEATPYYISHPHAPQRAFTVVPNARLILLLRNPVERAYSHYNHEVRTGVEPLPFEEALDKEEERLHQEMEKLQRDENYRSFNFQHYSYLSRGIYVDQIQAWRRYFAPEAMLILSSEELYNAAPEAIRRVIDFLGLADWQLNGFKKYHHTPYPQMDSGTRKRLADYYRSHNERLYEYLDVDLGWEKHEESIIEMENRAP